MNPPTRSRLMAVAVTIAAAVWAAPAASATAAPVSTPAMPAAVDQVTPDTAAIPRWLHQLPPQQYTTFNGQHSLTLTPWQGQHVAVLVPDARSAAVMAKILSALDRAWSYYRAT